MCLKIVLSFLLLASLVAASDKELFVAGPNDCKWDCTALDGQALQTFSEWTGPSFNTKIEVARLDIQTGTYVGLASYPSLHNINAAVYWQDNITYPGETWDKLFVAERRDLIDENGQAVKKHYLVQLCPDDDMFFRRAVLPNRLQNGGMYFVASTNNDGQVWMSAGGHKDIVNIDFSAVAGNLLAAPAASDLSTYSSFQMDSGKVSDLAWYEPCQIFVGISARGSSVSDSAVMLFDYDAPTPNSQSFVFPEGIDGPQDRHKAFGACYTFKEGNAILCSGNGNPTQGISGALYAVEMDPVTCVPQAVRFRVPSQSSTANDGTTCRFPGTLPCIPAYVESAPVADICGMTRVMAANTPSTGGSGQWTQPSGSVTVTFSDTSDPNAVVTAPAAGSATLRWTLLDPLCADDTADILVNFGSGCCQANEYVDDNSCQPCSGVYVNPAGDNPDGDDTACVWPICPDHSVYVTGQCKCVTGYTNDPAWTGAIWTNTCKKICKFCT